MDITPLTGRLDELISIVRFEVDDGRGWTGNWRLASPARRAAAVLTALAFLWIAASSWPAIDQVLP